MSATTSVVIMSGLMMLHKIRSAEMHTKKGTKSGTSKKGVFGGLGKRARRDGNLGVGQERSLE